jgi:hypothetical protein
MHGQFTENETSEKIGPYSSQRGRHVMTKMENVKTDITKSAQKPKEGFETKADSLTATSTWPAS